MIVEYFKTRARPKLMDRSMETSLDERAVNISMQRKENVENGSPKQLTKDNEHDRTLVLLVSFCKI